MSELTLVSFVAAGSGGQHVAVNPDFVRCLFALGLRLTAIDMGDEAPVKVEADLVDVARSLGFRLVSDKITHKP